MKIYFATWLEDNQGETLSKAGAKQRLLSYYFLRDMSPDFVKEYVTKGKVSLSKKEKGEIR